MFALAPLVGMAHRMFPPRLRRGTRHPDAPLSPCFAAESVRADTLRAHPENTARHLGWPSVRVEGRCRPKVTSGCPKRSEGGCPCRNEDEHRPSSTRPKQAQKKAGEGAFTG